MRDLPALVRHVHDHLRFAFCVVVDFWPFGFSQIQHLPRPGAGRAEAHHERKSDCNYPACPFAMRCSEVLQVGGARQAPHAQELGPAHGEDAQLLLESELAQVKPDVIVAPGSTALKAITGEHATLKDVLGQPFLH